MHVVVWRCSQRAALIQGDFAISISIEQLDHALGIVLCYCKPGGAHNLLLQHSCV